MKKLLLGLSLSLFASTAFAADAIVEEAVEAAPVFIWTGGYIGLQAGYAWGDGSIDESDGPGFADFGPEGFIGGVYAGYNYQMSNNFVIGAEVDVVYADVDGEGVVFDGPGDPVGLAEQKLNWSGAGRLRLGYAVDRFLPYIAGGVAFGDLELSPVGVPGAPTFSDTFVGWTIGGGLDYAFTDKLIFRAEYRYTDFGSETFDDGEGGFDMELDTHDFRLGIAYKF